MIFLHSDIRRLAAICCIICIVNLSTYSRLCHLTYLQACYKSSLHTYLLKATYIYSFLRILFHTGNNNLLSVPSDLIPKSHVTKNNQREDSSFHVIIGLSANGRSTLTNTHLPKILYTPQITPTSPDGDL